MPMQLPFAALLQTSRQVPRLHLEEENPPAFALGGKHPSRAVGSSKQFLVGRNFVGVQVSVEKSGACHTSVAWVDVRAL